MTVWFLSMMTSKHDKITETIHVYWMQVSLRFDTDIDYYYGTNYCAKISTNADEMFVHEKSSCRASWHPIRLLGPSHSWSSSYSLGVGLKSDIYPRKYSPILGVQCGQHIKVSMNIPHKLLFDVREDTIHTDWRRVPEFYGIHYRKLLSTFHCQHLPLPYFWSSGISRQYPPLFQVPPPPLRRFLLTNTRWKCKI